MNDRIHCFIADSDQARLLDAADTAESMRANMVEDYADNLMDECKTLTRAEVINADNDLYDGFLLSQFMCMVANWNGRTNDAVDRIRGMHVLLANELQKIAEREVEA